jgi:UDP-N-acetylmuramate dehydrogenase
MMAAARASQRLIDRLPSVRGRLSEQVALAPVTWFRVGGAAEVMFRPADIDDLAAFLAAKPADVPVTVIGVDGVVVRLGRGFVEVKVEGNFVVAGAGALDLNVALACRDGAVAGLEFMSGIPGTVGGGLRMNAGAYGSEIKDVLREATVLDPNGGQRVLPAAALGLSYRHCNLPEDCIFVAARFAGRPGDSAEIGRRMAEIHAAREASQPIRARTGGSTFANPPGHKAWELIDRAGCRGMKRGGAMISEKHANFLINAGNATAADLEALGEDVRRRVHETCGVMLEWEIRRIGRPGGAA